MFSNIPYNKIILSKLNSEIKNINFQNYCYNYLKTDFILDTKFLFPISIKTNQTSTDLFSHFYYKKYLILQFLLLELKFQYQVNHFDYGK